MSDTALRSLVAQGVIGLAVCVGGYAAVVMPLRDKLATARQELAETQAAADASRSVEASMATVMDRLADADRRTRAVVDAGALARSQEALYTMISARASDLGVRIDEFTPENTAASPAPARAAGAPADVVLRCRFVATGSYSKLASLLRAITEEGGFGVVREVRLTPGGPGSEVHAEVQTEHYSVDPSPVAPIGGEGHP